MIAALRNNLAVLVGLLMLFALLLNREGTWVPSGNENIYLLYLIKAWHHGFLASDFTFQEPTAGHPVFNFLFGWPTLFMPVEVLGWIGRIFSWAVLLLALMRIGEHFRIRRWVIFFAILLWLIQRQSFVANEWIIGTFEAKCVGYACLLFAIDLILRGWVLVPAILTGLCFTFHLAVGLWGGAAVGLAFVSTHSIKDSAKFVGLALLASLPGLIPSLGLIFGGKAISPAEAKFMVTIEMPFHLDPLTFGTAKIAVLYLMLLFDYLHYRANPNDKDLKFLIRFQLCSGEFFLMGIGFRLMGLFSLVQLFPFRVFAVTQMLMFFWHLAAAYAHRRQVSPRPFMIAVGLLTFFCLPSPMMRLANLASDQLPKWRHPQDDFLAAADWTAKNAPENAVVIAPPWRKETFYRVRRPLIADWHVPCFIAMTQWKERIELLVGDVSHMDVADNLAGEMDQRAQDHYAHLSESDITGIVQKYGGEFLISSGQYGYPVVFSSGDYRVYRLGR